MTSPLPLPLRSPRTQLRMLAARDLDRFVAYRNDPDIVRYQDWTLPYTLDAAAALLAGQDGLDGPVPDGDMVQLAIDVDGEIVGDVAIELRHGGETAGLGYTLAPEAQCHGYAMEVVGAVVDTLFANGVRRIVASTDPENLASIRVLDLTGFRCEGLARAAELVRGEWVDDLRFAILPSDRAEWLARPRTVERFELVEMDSEHARAVAQLAPHRHQDGFVSPIGATLAQSIAPPLEGGQRERPWCRVILADGVVAGFVMVALPSGEPDPYLWRLLIDRLHQGRGLGAATVRSLIEQFTAEGHETLVVSWVEGVGGPRRFYERLGFVEVGPTPDGETEARRPLQQQ